MKYAIIIPDGAADDPLKELNGKTPLEAANIPHMDRVAAEGRVGLVRTVPEGFESGSDVATMCLLGYDPKVYHTGRAPLEAAAQNIPLAPTDWVFRCNLVTVVDGIMKDHSAGGISDAEAQTLIRELARKVDAPGFEFYTGVSYRNLLVYRGHEEFDVTTKPPHEIPDEVAAKYLPKGKGAEILKRIIDASKELFADHEINQVRMQTGHNPASQVWLWGQGHAPSMKKFKDRFNVDKGAMITGVDLLRGLAVLLGWENLAVPGMTSFHDTDYKGQGEATAAALDKYDIVFSHIEAPDEASHQADWKTKVDAIEHIDKFVVGPVLEKLKTFPEWRILVMPDHPTNIATRKHGYAPTLFGMAGTRVKSHRNGKYDEKHAAAGDLKIERGHELMEFFLHGGNLEDVGRRMTIDFENTLEDFKEAQNAHARSTLRTGRRGRQAFAAILAFLLCMAVVLSSNVASSSSPTRIAYTVIIATAVLVIVLGTWLFATRKRTKQEQPIEQFVDAKPTSVTPIWRGLVGWVVFIMLAVFFFNMLSQSPTTSPPTSPTSTPANTNPVLEFILPLIPWLLVFGFIWFFVFRALRGRITQMWERNPSLQLRKHVDADENRIVIDDGQARTEMKWRAIRRYVETPNLFMLYTTEYLFYMIPKRAFVSTGAEEFRELLRLHVQPQIQAFPVQPIALSTPLPPPPLPDRAGSGQRSS